MTKLGFTDIHTIESLRRILCVKKYEMQEFDFNMDWRPVRPETTTGGANGAELKADDTMKDDTTINPVAEKQESVSKPKRKMRKTNDEENEGGSENESSSSDDDDNERARDNKSKTIYSTKAINLQPGHTGFLTFATLLAKDVF